MHFMCVLRVLFVLFLPFLSLFLSSSSRCPPAPYSAGDRPPAMSMVSRLSFATRFIDTLSFRTAPFSNSLKLQPFLCIITFQHDNIMLKRLLLLCLVLETTQIYRHRNGHTDTQSICQHLLIEHNLLSTICQPSGI